MRFLALELSKGRAFKGDFSPSFECMVPIVEVVAISVSSSFIQR